VPAAIHRLGLLLVLASAILFSLSGVLTKTIAADTWTILCWRGLIGGLIVVTYVGWQGRGEPLAKIFGLGWRGWLLALEGAAASVTFILSFKLTYVANVAVIYAAAPFMAAALGWLLAREALDRAVLSAASLSFIGIAIVVSGGIGTGHLEGDMVAILMAGLNALYIVLIRRFSRVPAVLAGGVSALILVPLGWLAGDPVAVAGRDAMLLVLFGVVFAAANVLWTEGTKRVTAAESALVGTSETPFAMLLAWLILWELPPVTSFAGGAVVLTAVLAHILWTQRKENES
jgi:drug/metabolite transporter (DMT)-like permease